MERHKPRKKLTQAQEQWVLEMLSGKSPRAVARETGVSLRKVYDIRRNLMPRLRLQSVSVALFTDRERIARYATVGVAAVSKVEALDCRAWVEVLAPRRSLPLHWAGTQLSPDEATAPRLTINPQKPARLDVAFALPTPGLAARHLPYQNSVMSGQVPVVRFPSEVGRIGAASWDGKGCWLAQPAALYNPDPRLDAYLLPGEYRIKIAVECRGGEGDEGEFILVSPQSWEGLQLR